MSFNMRVEKNIPLRIKIADQLRELIKNEYLDGGQIPSEDELSYNAGYQPRDPQAGSIDPG